MKEFSIWAIPLNPLRNELFKLIKYFHKKYKTMDRPFLPHLTIKNVFSISDLEIENLIKFLKGICSKTNPFTIRINKIQLLEDTIFIKVEKTKELEQLHIKIAKKLRRFSLAPQYELKNYYPHISIVYDNSIEKLIDITKEFGSIKIKNNKTKIDKIHLVVKEGKKEVNYRIFKTLPFNY